MGDWPGESGLSALHIRRACEASLKRLQTDHIDLYQMHHIDQGTPWEEIWEAFGVLHQQGKVLYYGSSNFAGWHIAQAQEAARSRHFLGLVSEQSIYNLMSRWAELEVLPAARQYGVGGVTGPIVGPRTVEQLDGSLRALQITLDDGTLAKLDELFPPPAPNGAKPAPEAYAW